MEDSEYVMEYSESWALLVGIDAYSHLSPLQAAVNDARGVAEKLKRSFGFPSDQIWLLEDKQATARAVVEHLEVLARRTGPNDRALFFFAGHGQTRPTPLGGRIGYIAVPESQPGHWSSWIPLEDVCRYSSLISAKHILYIFDACFSGLALERGVPALAEASNVPRWIADCMTHRARQALTAGLADQAVGDISEDGHSIFTSHLLMALDGGAEGSQGEITAARVMARVADEVMKASGSNQTPAFGDLSGSQPGGDFVFKHPWSQAVRVSVPADREGGIDTGVHVNRGSVVSISASGVVSFDAGHHFTNAEGLLCTYKGQPLAHATELKPMIRPEEGAYRTRGGEVGRVGSLIGWIGEYSQQAAFLVGEEITEEAKKEGYLCLAVNDVPGAFGDNEGRFEVSIRLQ